MTAEKEIQRYYVDWAGFAVSDRFYGGPGQLPVRATSREDARDRAKAWVALNNAFFDLAKITGHEGCNEHCDCPDWLREAKAQIEKVRQEVTGGDTD